MYQTLKSIVFWIVPRQIILRFEQQFRSLVTLFYKGKQTRCLLCEVHLRKFIDHKTGKLCPNCGSLSRSRILWHFLNQQIFSKKEPLRVLHFSAQKYLAKKIRALKHLQYTTTDYESDVCDQQYDITQIACADQSFDLIICYHVLEHIKEDQKALQELYRILKPGGMLLLQVPFHNQKTIEEPFNEVFSEAKRTQLFGQKDHVRIYSKADFKQRIKAAGFQLEVLNYVSKIEGFRNFGLEPSDHIFIATK